MKKLRVIVTVTVLAMLALAIGQRLLPTRALAAPSGKPEPAAPARPAAPSAPAQQQVEDPKAVYRVPLDGSPVRGPADALVTIVEVSDFECPFCKKVAPTLKQLDDE